MLFDGKVFYWNRDSQWRLDYNDATLFSLEEARDTLLKMRPSAEGDELHAIAPDASGRWTIICVHGVES